MTRETYNKYKDVIEAWANGAEVQYFENDRWYTIKDNNKLWLDHYIYRVKPEYFKGDLRKDRLYKLDFGSGSFCHIATTVEEVRRSYLKDKLFWFVGRIITEPGERNIFYTKDCSCYVMFDSKVKEYIKVEYTLDKKLIKGYEIQN
jgi:hypothetical protein